MTERYLIAGFGGQGVLFAGKLLVSIGLLRGKQVSWLPSYGPEMRGGTANCSVVIGDEPVSSPIVDRPDILAAMNLPSLDKYEGAVTPGGWIFIDSSLADRGAGGCACGLCARHTPGGGKRHERARQHDPAGESAGEAERFR